MNVVIKEMQSEEVAYIEKLYESSFPSAEKKPFSWMMEGNERMNVIYAQENLCGLLFTLENEGSVLIDYLAIDPKYQGSGIGTKVLNMFFKKTEKAIILEIEDPNVDCIPEEKELRKRRKAFYLQSGMRVQSYRVDLFGVRMEMVSTIEQFPYERYLELLKECLFEGVEQYVAKI
ncbi:hypothetical protein C815_02203 [Firmicutes bacterium M10-2]|nr:hypothetical protein C815_02203 [Firmicutes bacterium M10-2]